MIGHVVMWKVRPEHRSTGLPEMKQRLESLKQEISEIQSIEVGINVLNSDAAYDIVLVSTFKSIDDLLAYQKHKAHIRVVEFIRTISLDRKVVDYEK